MNFHADIFKVLKADHDKHREILDRLHHTRAGDAERAHLFEQLTRELKAHAAAEEQALYSTVMRKPHLTDDTRHSVAEHQEIEEMLNDLAATDLNSEEWDEDFDELSHRYLHHINEEEDEHFPEFAEELTDGDREWIANVFERRKPVEKANAEITPEKKEDAKE